MGEFRNSTIRYEELKNERKDLLAACWTGEHCGKNLENYHNKCCDVKTWTRCWLARVLDDNKMKMEGYGIDEE